MPKSNINNLQEYIQLLKSYSNTLSKDEYHFDLLELREGMIALLI